jgi:Type VI secretion system/phage-baseplate injector OB domain
MSAVMQEASMQGERSLRYYGKYRGTVINNLDPEQRGRIMAMVPDVLGLTPSSWAMPCVPAAGIQSGMFIVPPIGSGVWIEFEQGEAEYPIWTGGFWGLASEVPALALVPPAIPPGQNIVLQTTAQNTLVLSDSVPTPATGGIVLKSRSGATIVVNDTGIYIQNGKGASLTMIGPTVTINNGALTVI